MDHKISKDMISSGMIPSGEKTQADLGRTQYGSAPSPSSLMDAYKKIYEHHQKDADGKVIEHEEEEIKEMSGGGETATTDTKTTTKTKKPGLIQRLNNRTKATNQAIDQLNQDVDLFDIIKGTLLDEGVEEEEALRIMANLSEEERESLLQNINELFGIKNRIDNKLNQMRNNSKLGGNKRVDDVRTNSGDPNVGTKINFGN